MISDQRRRHPRSSRMLFLSLAILGFINPCHQAPLTDTRPSSSSSSSSSSSAAKKSQEVGSPSELAWQAWLLVDAQPGSQSNLDSASILRRITPKSVFIAPALPACAEGYRADTMGRCVKNVNIDQEAQINFLLQRLNAMYANHPASPVAAASSSHDNKQSSGPLQVNIPLVSTNSQTSKVESDEHEEPEDVPLRLSVLPHSEEKKHEDAIVTVYEIKNETTVSKDDKEEEETFFLGHPSAPGANESDHDDKKKPDAVVPVAEFVEEANETSFSDVVDYKISLDLKTLLNVSRMKLANETDETSVNQTQTNSTETSPTLVLLLSPTKLPHMSPTPDLDQLELAHNGSAGHVFVHMANLTGNFSEKEIISVSVPESILQVKKLSEVVQEPVGGREKNESGDESVDIHNTKVNDSQEVEYEDEEEEDEDYVDATDLPEEESLEADGGEILKHGEAGMTIPVKNIDRINFEKHRQSMKQTEELIDVEHSTELPTDAIYIRLNESASSDKDEAGSNVSSEVSIDGDFIMETTVLNVNTGKTKNVTLANHTVEDGKFEDSSSEPEVIFAPQDMHGTTSHNRKRVETIFPGTIRIENVKIEEKSEPQKSDVSTSSVQTERLHEELKEAEFEAPPSSETLLYDSHRPNTESRDAEETQPITEIRTMDEVSFNEDALIPEDSKEFLGTTGPGVPLSSFRPAPLTFKPAQDYVRFPSYIRSPESHVRFPSEEANSIHGQDYKDRAHSTEDGLRNSAKNGIHQKPSYWWVPPGWRTENHSATVQATAASESHQIRQKPRPMLVRFWTSLYPTSSQVASTSDSYEGQRQNGSRVSRPSSRRVTYYKEMSPQDVNRVFAQKSRTPIGG